MFGIGTYEMLIILAVGLMLFSPKELPGVLRGIARFWASIRRTADEFRDAIMQDEDLREVREVLDGARHEVLAAERAAREELERARMQVREAEAKLAEAVRRSEAAALEEHAAALEDEAARLSGHDRPAVPEKTDPEATDAAGDQADDGAEGFTEPALAPPRTVASAPPAGPSPAVPPPPDVTAPSGPAPSPPATGTGTP